MFRGLRPRQEAVNMAIEPRKYETLYLVRPDISPEDLLTIQNRVEQSVTGNGGELIKSEKWAERDLAYRIENYTRGTYYIAVYAAEPKAVTDIERYFNLSKNNVLRFMTVNYIEEEQKPADVVISTPPQASEPEDQSAFQTPPSAPEEQQAEQSDEAPKEAAEQAEQSDEAPKEAVEQAEQSDEAPKEAAEQAEQSDEAPKEAVEQAEQSDEAPKEAVEQAEQSDEAPKEAVEQTGEDEEKAQGGEQS